MTTPTLTFIATEKNTTNKHSSSGTRRRRFLTMYISDVCATAICEEGRGWRLEVSNEQIPLRWHELPDLPEIEA